MNLWLFFWHLNILDKISVLIRRTYLWLLAFVEVCTSLILTRRPTWTNSTRTRCGVFRAIQRGATRCGNFVLRAPPIFRGHLISRLKVGTRVQTKNTVCHCKSSFNNLTLFNHKPTYKESNYIIIITIAKYSVLSINSTLIMDARKGFLMENSYLKSNSWRNSTNDKEMKPTLFI